MTKKTHGGKREGAGRPKKEPTEVISIRIKTKNKAKIKAAIIPIIKKLDN